MAKERSTNSLKHPNDVLHVLVLIAGTTDPINATTAKSKHANSYENETSQDLAKQNLDSYTNVPVNYWDKEFKEQIEALDGKYVNLVLFPFHGWTGDNSKNNREIAGAYLVNRLCGANGEEAYYQETYQNKPIHFHLLGHSHGGNVINEMTKQIDTLGDTWPKQWKIKSLIYLSTPFFEKLHQVKVSEKFFHKEAEVFHAFNKYDLTQRMLADFSLEALADAINKIDTKPLTDAINSTIELFLNIPFKNLGEFHWERGGARYMNHQNGLDLYKKTMNSLKIETNGLGKIFKELSNLIALLHQPYSFDTIKKNIKNSSNEKPNNTRQLIKDPAFTQLNSIIATLQADIKLVIEALEERLKKPGLQNTSSKFDKADYFNDMFKVNSFFLHLIDLIDIDSTTLVPKNPTFSLWNNLCFILKDNIETFDNTYADPTIQFKGSFLENKISFKEVTSDDLYDGSDGSKNYDTFIEKIEKIEEKYKTNPSQTNLLDLLFTLLAQDESLYQLIKSITSKKKWLNYGEYIATGDLDAELKKVRYMLENIEKIFDDRYCALLDTSHKLTKEQEINNEDDNPYNDTLQRGEIMYLLVESHSTSRRCLHTKLKEFIERVGAKR